MTIAAVMWAVSFIGATVALISFSVLAYVLATTHAAGTDVLGISTRRTLLAGALLYVYVAAAWLAVALHMVPGVTEYEGYIEIIFPVLLFAAASAARNAQQIGDLEHSQRALGASYDLMLQIIDQAPAGIVFLDDVGHMTFANDAAREVLDLEEDEETGRLKPPVWTGTGPDGGPFDFTALAGTDVRMENIPVVVQWHSGWKVKLRVSIEPMRDATGKIGGHIATFERPARGIGGRDF